MTKKDLQDIYKLSGIPKEFWNKGFDDYVGYCEYEDYEFLNEKEEHRVAMIATVIENYFSSFEEHLSSGYGMIFWGRSGSGKSLLMSSLLKSAIDDYRKKAKFINMGSFYNTYVNGWKDSSYSKLVNVIMKVSVLGIDEFKIENTKPSFVSFISRIVNYRTSNNKPLFITTNHTPKQINMLLGDSLYSKLKGKCLFLNCSLKNDFRYFTRNLMYQKLVGDV